ncbi:MAG: hypothetical protein WDN48_06285 [Pseudolabrys sp.]
MIIHPVANAVADRLLAALKAKRLAPYRYRLHHRRLRSGGAFRRWSPEETHTMIDAVLRRVVEKA